MAARSARLTGRMQRQPHVGAFFGELRRVGYVEGNLIIERYSAGAIFLN